MWGFKFKNKVSKLNWVLCCAGIIVTGHSSLASLTTAETSVGPSPSDYPLSDGVDSFSARNSSINDILRSDHMANLQSALRSQMSVGSKDRACFFQKKHELPPTFCFYSSMPLSARERLVAVCQSRARRTKIVPAVDDSTDPRCRKALEGRRLDLAYAME
jgi:hypothetical protein